MARPVKRTRRPAKKSLPCYFTETGTTPDYKDVLVLRKFITERGKILHQSYSGLTAKNQRLVAEAIKRARYMALLPYTDKHAI